MEMVFISLLMKISIMEHGLIIVGKVLESISGRMVRSIRESGKMTG